MRYGIDCKLEDSVSCTVWVEANSEQEALEKFKASKMYKTLGSDKIVIIRTQILNSREK